MKFLEKRYRERAPPALHQPRCIVIRNHRARILGTIVIAHAHVWRPNEGCVAEDDPRLLGPCEKPPPENVKSHRTSEVSPVSRASAVLRVRNRSVATATAEARTTESATTVTIQAREVRPLASKLFDA